MSATENKVFYGLSNVYIVPVTSVTDGVPTYGTPFKLPGAVSWSEEPAGENAPFRADNSNYYMAYGNDGYTGDLEVALVNKDFHQKILGEVAGANGEAIEVVQGEAIPFALILQIEGDKEATRHVYPYCTAGRPTTDHATTEEGAITPGTETITITAEPIKITGFSKKVPKYRVPASASNYDTILSTFSLPTAATSA